MKLKQVFGSVAISAVTAFAVIAGYSHFSEKDTRIAGQDAAVLPANYKYVGLNDGNNAPPTPVDFTVPAQAATPAVVHIKTKTNAKQVTNNLPRVQRQNPFSDFFR